MEMHPFKGESSDSVIVYCSRFERMLNISALAASIAESIKHRSVRLTVSSHNRCTTDQEEITSSQSRYTYCIVLHCFAMFSAQCSQLSRHL